ncbi:MAG: response regulator [Candidatus Wallbacteria bacterium]|nr:response regulator [Candidatus Wallbacteria bacterium]
MSRSLKALFVEDDENDVRLLLREMQRAGFEVVHSRVDSSVAMSDALTRDQWDLVISDYTVPGYGPFEALALLKRLGLDLPFIVVSGTMSEDSAVDILRAGAHDFVLKGRLARLVPAIERELRELVERRARRQAEEALRASQLLYRRIVETAHEGIWMVDENAHTTFLNRRMADLFGVEPAAAVGTSAAAFVENDWWETFAARMAPPAGAEAIPGQFDCRLKRADGAGFWASLSTNAIADESGCQIGFLAMVTDVTEQRHLQEQVMVSDRLASVGMLAAGVAHEINNPLLPIIGNLQMALPVLDQLSKANQQRSVLDDARQGLRDALEAAERIREIVLDLRIFSRDPESRTGALDLRRVLESSLRLAANELRHRAKVTRRFDSIPPVLGNESRLGQVFLNLLFNAAQALPEGRAASHEVTVVTCTDDRGRAVVEVSDTGCGMSPEVQRKLFTPFFTTKPVGVGTGLGLSICHRTISAMGGEISVESTAGKGSCVRVVLPAASQARQVQSESPAAAATVRSGCRARILLVDDETLILHVLKRVLHRDHEVFCSTGARPALGWIEAGERYDLILCDLMMPDVTGMEFFAELQRFAPTLCERVVFMTGGAFTPGARGFLQQTRNLCLEKPIDPPELEALVAKKLASFG